MKTKLWASTALLLVLTCTVVWWSESSKAPAGDHPNQAPPGNPGEATSSGDDVSGLPNKSPRPDPMQPGKVEVVDQLENLATVSPGLIGRMNLAMFDNNLSPNPSDWELLGLGKEVAEAVSNHLRGVFQQIREKEASSFSVVEQTENRVRISIPKFNAEDTAKHVSRIEESYAKVFGPELSRQLTRLFIDSHPAIAGGINGRDRVITVTTASAEAITKLNRKYEIKTQTLFEGTKLADALGKLDDYSQNQGIELVEEIPESWAHLFGNSD